ncbi:MarR family winged helix-turn-helix transcriptional regulator [Aurantiacibacter flavus]|uniref:MarR family winged helix-turn-helix transcriptional regulator n=1 Tax=Aurantiacibacter flavus TaxID=3145232 RepID=UPI003217E781
MVFDTMEDPILMASADTEDPARIAEETLFLVLELSNLFTAPYSEHLGIRHDLTLNEHRTLLMISELGEVTAGELANTIGVSIMTINRAVTKLKKQGRIVAREDEANRRRRPLRLTQAGMELAEEMRPESRRVASFAMSELELDEVMALRRHLQKMVATLRSTDKNGENIFRQFALKSRM